MNNNKKIVIAGAGSIGCYVGGRLATSHDNVHFFARPRMAQDLTEHGLQVTDWTGVDHTLPAHQLNVSTDASILSDADLILICVKSKDTAEMAKTIQDSGNQHATIFSLQNGVGNAQVIQEILPQHRVLPVMVPYNVVYMAGNEHKPAHFHCGTEGELYCQQDPQAHDLQSACDAAQLALQLKADMPSILWGKLLLNLNNPVNALAGIPLKQQLETRAYRNIYGTCLKEGLAVLKAANITPGQVAAVPVKAIPIILALPDFLFKRIAQKMLAMDPLARSSMWEDLENNRPVEVDYINGEIVKLGQQVGVATPMNQRLIDLVKQAQGNGSPQLSPEQIVAKL